MNTTKIKAKIFLTNWVSVVGILLAVYLFAIINELVKKGITGDSLWVGFIGGLIGIALYGSIFFAGFILCMLLLDFILIGTEAKNLKVKLITEWILVSSPFVYWIFKYTEWVFLVAIITFLITQAIREKLILKLFSQTAPSE